MFDVRFWGPAVAAQKANIKAGGSITLSTGEQRTESGNESKYLRSCDKLEGQTLVRPRPNWTLTSGITGAVDSLARGLAVDLAPLRVNVVSPGLVRTEVRYGDMKE